MAKKVTALTLKYGPELQSVLEMPDGAEVLILDNNTNTIKRIAAALIRGATETIASWTPSGEYVEDDIKEFQLKLWKSSVGTVEDPNVGNTPVEGAFWTEVSKSTANGFGYYATGVYTVDPSMVVVDSSLYILNTSVVTLPFESTDFATELAEGKWQPLASSGVTNLDYTPSPTGGTVTSDTGTDATIPLVDATNAGLIAPATNTNIANHLSATAGAHLASAINPGGNAGKLAKSNAAGTGIDFTTYSADQVVQTSAIDYSDPDWLTSEARLLMTTKTSESGGTFDGSARLMDKFLPPGILTTLASSDSGWTNESRTITGDNSTFALGQKGQTGWLDDRTWVECVDATYLVAGSATFNRNRAYDALVITDAQDLAVINLLEPSRTGGTDDDGWNLTTNVKVISTVPCKLGTYWIGGTNGEGYFFSCFAVSGTSFYWKRLGQGASIQRPITTTSHPATTAALQAYNWSLGKYTQTSNPVSTDPYTYQDQTFIDDTNGYYYIKTDPTKWSRFETNKSPRTVSLSNAQIKALTTPVTLLSAPASGYMYKVDSLVLSLNAGTEVLTVSADSDLRVRYIGTTSYVSDNIETTGLLDQATDQIAVINSKQLMSGATSDFAAKGIEIVNLGTQIAGNASNDAIVDIILFYTLIKL